MCLKDRERKNSRVGVVRRVTDFLEGCWLQMASCSPTSTSSLCHWSRDLTGNPAIRTPAFLVSRRLVLEAASPAVCVCEREKKKRGRIVRCKWCFLLTGIIFVKLVKVSDLKQEYMVRKLCLHSMKLSHETRPSSQSRVEMIDCGLPWGWERFSGKMLSSASYWE